MGHGLQHIRTTIDLIFGKPFPGCKVVYIVGMSNPHTYHRRTMANPKPTILVTNIDILNLSLKLGQKISIPEPTIQDNVAD